VFAKFGMGPKARSNRASLAGIVADFNPPATVPLSSVSVQSTPNAAIPDNRAAGISSVISIPQTGRLQRITVSVDIKHTFIGDLVVSLQSAVGTRVVLHQRTGGGQDNIVKSFTSESVSGLAGLAGQEVQGDWVLFVADMAGQDVGVLQKWGLEIGLEPAAQTLRGETSPALLIPDAAPSGVTSTISIASPGIARGIIVELDITHTFIGDLSVELESPAGTVAVLHNRAGGNRDNLIATFDSAAATALATLLGQSAQGDWKLRVKDLAAADIGKLNRWSIRIDL
jgi:subtilisin-like proprotein convertase family protein